MTLINSSSAIVHVMSTVLQYPETRDILTHFPISEKEIEETIGIPLTEAVSRWVDPTKFQNNEEQLSKKVDTIVSDYREIFDSIGLPKIALLPYAKETLNCLKLLREKQKKGDREIDLVDSGLKFIGGSGVDPSCTLAELTVKVLLVSSRKGNSVHSILHHLDLYQYFDIVQGDLYGEQKGEFLQKHQADVYIGDHPGDVQGGKYAGALSIAVATGHIGKDRLREENPDLLWDDLSQFPQWLEEHLQQ